jgi:hypothetical protein
MGVRFQKRITLFPGVRLDFSASGVSTTIGPRGASLTLGGPRGTAVNLGLPGTGLSYRKRLDGHREAGGAEMKASPLPPPRRRPGRVPSGLGAAWSIHRSRT